MKIKDLVNYWDKHARGRLTRDAYFMALSDQHHKRLEKLAALYPMKSPQDLMRDLISAALDEMETSFPYVQGTKVVAYDEDGFEIYEDQGLTPKFVSLSQKHIQRPRYLLVFPFQLVLQWALAYQIVQSCTNHVVQNIAFTAVRVKFRQCGHACGIFQRQAQVIIVGALHGLFLLFPVFGQISDLHDNSLQLQA